MKYYCLAIAILVSMLSLNSQADDRKQKLLNILDEELSEVIRLNNQIQARNPNLLLRTAELYLEKARILKEVENERFLSLPFDKRQKVSKKALFKGSNRYFSKAQRVCLFILKKFGKFRGRGDVFYVLAFNAKEFQEFARAEKYFRLAIKGSSPNSATQNKSKLALAEMLYNRQKYKSAVPLYEVALSKEKSKWWTKDAYNLAWCYFRIGKTDRAIKLMNRVLSLSGNSQYIDMTYEVKRDLAYFYTESGQIQEALKFYQSGGGDIAKNLIRVARFLLDQSKLSSAEKILLEAKKHKTNDQEDIEINNLLMNLNEKFGKVKAHYQACEDQYQYYKQGKLSEEFATNLKYQIQKMGAVLQKQVVGGQYDRQISVKHEKAIAAVKYFELLAKIRTGESANFIYLAAETYYSAGFYDEAMAKYEESLKLSKTQSNQKFYSPSLKGMMATLGQKGLKKETLDRYLIPIYEIYIKSPLSKSGLKSVYQRLFSEYMKKEKVELAEKLVEDFRDKFPQESSIQEAMLARIMDYYKGKDNRQKIFYWSSKIKNGEFKVSKQYLERLRDILLAIQFDKVESYNTSGEKVKALKGYFAIYQSKNADKDAKKNAAYNIAGLFSELSYPIQTFKWAMLAFNLMDDSEVLKFDKSFLKMTNDVFNAGKIDEAFALYNTGYKKLCRKPSKLKNFFFKNMVVTGLANSKLTEVRDNVNGASSCRIDNKVQSEAHLELVNFLDETNNMNMLKQELEYIFKSNLDSSSMIPAIFHYARYAKKVRKWSEYKSYTAKIDQIFKTGVKKRQHFPLEALDIVAHLEISQLYGKARALNSVKLSFPEDQYNKMLRNKFSMLDSLTSKALAIMKIGSGKAIVKCYDVLSSTYDALVSDIERFVPKGKTPEYVDSFHKSMVELVGPLKAKAREFETTARKQIYANSILANGNYKFLVAPKFPARIKFDPEWNLLLMDRSGK